MKRKIVIALLSLLLFFAVGTVVAALYITNYTRELNHLVTLHQIENLRRDLIISIQTVQSDVYTVHTHLGQRLDSIIYHVTKLEEASAKCVTCHHSPGISKKLEHIEGAIQDYQTALSYYITASANVERIERIQLEAAAIGNDILNATESMSLTASARLAELTSLAMTKIATVKTILFITIVSAFLFAIVVSIHLMRSITRPMKELVNATNVIATGALGHKISYTDKTEFGELARNFNLMSDALKKSYENLKASNEELYREIMERKRAEEKIHKAYKLTNDILEKAPFGVYVVNNEGTIEYANQAMMKISGDTFQDLIGSNMNNIPEKVKIGLPERIKAALDGAPFFMEAVEYKSNDGDRLSIRNYLGIPFEEEVKKAVIFVEDITEKKKLEEQLLHSQKMEAIATLTGGIAHEFNNIVTAIIGFGDLLRDSIDEDDPLRSYVDMIMASSDRAARLTHGLLAYTRKQITHMKPTDLGTVITAVDRFLTSLVSEDIQLRIHAPEEELTIRADSAQIEQVIINLATNAMDAMPHGGVLTIRSERASYDKEFVAHQAHVLPGEYAVISVTDTGAGMDEETRKRIFEPFFTTKGVGRGTGLGLSIVYGIIEKHKGHIAVESEQDRGTSFKVYLPLSDVRAERIQAVRVPSEVEGSETILVAEDDDAVRNLISRVLEKSGYQTVLSVDGQEAVERYRQHKDEIQLLLLDLAMPRKSGKDAFEEIRRTDPGIPVIFISGYLVDDVRTREILTKGYPFVSKPVSPHELLMKIRSTLGSSAGA